MNETPDEQTWFVTGAQGFLGANAGIFLRDKAKTIGLTRTGSAPRLFDGAVTGDLTAPDEIAKAIMELKPSVVLHGAALASHEACEADPALATRINVDATRVLSRAAEDAGSKFIYISTDAVFDGARGDYTESDEPSPFSVYGETKLRGEQQAMAVTDALVVRTNFFGWSPSGNRSILEFFVNQLSAGLRVKGYPDFLVTSIYVQSLVETIWNIRRADFAGIIHIASSDALSKYDFGIAIAREFEVDEALISPFCATLSGHATSRSRNISLDTDLLASILGTPPETQADGIRRAHLDVSTLGATLRAMDVTS